MLTIFKVLIGVAGIGVGVGVPVVLNQISGGESISHLEKAIRFENAESKENAKLLEAFKDLQSKNCKIVHNADNPNNSFESIYACSESDNKFNAYYLGKREDVKKNGASEVKRIKTINYEKESSNNPVINLTLEDKSSSSTTSNIKMSVEEQGEGGWAHFKNFDVSSKCKIATPKLGPDVLECEVATSDKTYTYSFGIL